MVVPTVQQVKSTITAAATKAAGVVKNNPKTAIATGVVLAAGTIALAVKKAGHGEKCDHCG